MPSGSLLVYDAALDALLKGTLPPFVSSPISAVLLSPSYVPNLAAHANFSDISASELSSSDTARLQLTGANVVAAAFRSDTLIFGDPVTLGPVRYMAFVLGLPKSLQPSSPLLGVADLSPTGGALEAQRGRFEVSVPPGGWFSLARA
jgi:hypothetical protein